MKDETRDINFDIDELMLLISIINAISPIQDRLLQKLKQNALNIMVKDDTK